MPIKNFTTTGTTFSIVYDGLNQGTWDRLDELDSKYDVDIRDSSATLSLRNPGFSDVLKVGDTLQVNGVELTGSFREQMEALKNLVLYKSAAGSALPTETVATYSAMQTSITADPTTKRDFFVTADETNGGVATRYSYNGSAANRIINQTDLATKADLDHNHVLTDIVDYKSTMRQLFAGTMLSHTGDTSAWTAFTGTIPANSIGPNGTFLLTWELFGTSNANSKVARGRINGTAVFAFSWTTGVTFKGIGEIHNNNSLAAQVAMPVASQSMTYNTATSVTYATYTFDTTQDLTFTLELQLGVATDTATIVSFKLMAIG